MSEPTRRRGRPRQPFCPRCKAEGTDGVAKAPGCGYCSKHQVAASKASRERYKPQHDPILGPDGMGVIDPNDTEAVLELFRRKGMIP